MTGYQDIRNSASAASVGVAISGVIWGLTWIPVRGVEAVGLAGPWCGISLLGVTSLVLLPFFISQWHRARHRLGLIALCGLVMGAGFGMFTTAIVLTDVIRATLLFYLSPVWATIVGALLLGERVGPTRLVAVALGLLGGWAILNEGAQSLPLPRNAGDWLALASGITFAFGSFLMLKFTQITVREQVFSFIGGAWVTSLVIAGVGFALGIEAIAVMPQVDRLAPAALWLAAAAMFFVPLAFLTIWPAKVLSPGRVSLLLMGEIIVATVSVAILLDEPFRWEKEGLGAALIVSAGLLETLGKRD